MTNRPKFNFGGESEPRKREIEFAPEEAPTEDQRWLAKAEAAAHELASGKPDQSVRAELAGHGAPESVVGSEGWEKIWERATALIQQNHRRNQINGWLWIMTGGAPLLGFFYFTIFHWFSILIPILFIVGFLPFMYGVHLLKLKPHERPTASQPRIFGKGL